jgi:gluconolactonase
VKESTMNFQLRTHSILCGFTIGVSLIAVTLAAVVDGIAAERLPLFVKQPVKREAIVAFTEGPAYHPTGNVYFTDIVNNRIMRRDSTGATHVFRTPSGRANGLLFDHLGRLMACEGGREGGNRRVTRTEHNGTVTVLADNFQGKKFNSPNDLAIDSKGRVYFSDPRYGGREDMQQIDANGKPIEGVYRIDTDGKVTRIIDHEVDRPNGILVSPGDKKLFVAGNVNDGPNNGLGGARRLWRFDLNADGTVDKKSRKLLFDWGPDRGPEVGSSSPLDSTCPSRPSRRPRNIRLAFTSSPRKVNCLASSQYSKTCAQTAPLAMRTSKRFTSPPATNYGAFGSTHQAISRGRRPSKDRSQVKIAAK